MATTFVEPYVTALPMVTATVQQAPPMATAVYESYATGTVPMVTATVQEQRYAARAAPFAPATVHEQHYATGTVPLAATAHAQHATGALPRLPIATAKLPK